VALPAHVLLEAYSVLTRLPSGLAVAPASAADVLQRRFPRAPLRLGEAERGDLLKRLDGAGIIGGAGYDGLVALEAAAHGHTLLTLDARAQTTYQRLGVGFSVIATG
jgi:toxin FitB